MVFGTLSKVKCCMIPCLPTYIGRTSDSSQLDYDHKLQEGQKFQSP